MFIGATDREGSQQRMQFTFLRDRLVPVGCEVIPVHPTRPAVLGVRAYPSVLDVEGDVDLAVVLVRDALPAVEQCVHKGVAFVLVFSAGFAEMETKAGRAAQDQLTELGCGRTRIIGPNTSLNFFEPWRQDLPGKKLAIVTQSGFQGRPISRQLALEAGNDIAELDINPVMVRSRGHGVTAVDALIVPRHA